MKANTSVLMDRLKFTNMHILQTVHTEEGTENDDKQLIHACKHLKKCEGIFAGFIRLTAKLV
jgi:hypothetical protein